MTLALDTLLEVSPGTRGSKPCIAGTRIAVHDIVLMHLRLGQSLEQIAATYDLPMAGVHAAMAYYYQHRDEIERKLDADRELGERLRAAPSLVQAKLGSARA